MKIFFKTIYYIVLAGLGAVAIFLVASLLPIPGNYKVKVVLSGSMEPTIKTGGIIVARPASEYHVGDIITFGKDTKTEVPITHRIVSEKDGAFITRGDANDIADTHLVQRRDIIGKVFFSIPYVGYAVDAAKTPTGFVLLIIIPALVIILDELRKIVREFRRMRTPLAQPVERREAPSPPRRRMIV
jgi:signal peptidase